MKKFVKKNYLILISISILLGVLFYHVSEFKKWDSNYVKTQLESEKRCATKEWRENEIYKDYCDVSDYNRGMKVDFYTMLSSSYASAFTSLSLVIFFFIAIPGLNYICSYFKNGIMKNEIQRKSYRSLLTKVLKESYKTVFILPIILSVAMLVCILYTNTFNPEYALGHSSIGWSASTVANPVVFIVLYIIATILYSTLYINICLCVVRKFHNYFVAIILSFLVLIGLEAFLEIGINTILFGIVLKSDLGFVFNIVNIFNFSDSHGLFYTIFIPLFFVILSFIVLYFMYKDRESLLIDCEKDE